MTNSGVFCACGHVNHYGTWLPASPSAPKLIYQSEAQILRVALDWATTELAKYQRASLPPEAPEGAKVTWRVDVHKTLGPEVQLIDCDDEAQADQFLDTTAGWRFTARSFKVKVTTIEEFVAVREAGK